MLSPGWGRIWLKNTQDENVFSCTHCRSCLTLTSPVSDPVTCSAKCRGEERPTCTCRVSPCFSGVAPASCITAYQVPRTHTALPDLRGGCLLSFMPCAGPAGVTGAHCTPSAREAQQCCSDLYNCRHLAKSCLTACLSLEESSRQEPGPGTNRS